MSIDSAVRWMYEHRAPVRRRWWPEGMQLEVSQEDDASPVLVSAEGERCIFVPEKLDYLMYDWCSVHGELLEEEEPSARGFYAAMRYLYVVGAAVTRAAWSAESCVYIKDFTEGALIMRYLEEGIASESPFMPTKFDYLGRDWKPWVKPADFQEGEQDGHTHRKTRV